MMVNAEYKLLSCYCDIFSLLLSMKKKIRCYVFAAAIQLYIFVYIHTLPFFFSSMGL